MLDARSSGQREIGLVCLVAAAIQIAIGLLATVSSDTIAWGGLIGRPAGIVALGVLAASGKRVGRTLLSAYLVLLAVSAAYASVVVASVSMLMAGAILASALLLGIGAFRLQTSADVDSIYAKERDASVGRGAV